MLPLDTEAEAARIQLQIHRRMAPEARLRVALELTRVARSLLVNGIRSRHPEYDERQVELAAIRVWLTPEVFRIVYPTEPELAP